MIKQIVEKRSRFHNDYLPADTYVGINEDDSVLTPIYLSLPKPPDIRYIDGYGKPPLEQKWERLELPPRLKRIEEKAYDQLYAEQHVNKHETVTGYKIQKRFWELFDQQREHLENEINYIKRIHYYMCYGYWFFNKGKPTWLTPWHFTYLQFCYVPKLKKYVDYRDVDRRSEVFKWYEYTTHETFKHIDNKGIPQFNELGEYEMIELENRTCYGDQEAKRRRQGATMNRIIKLKWITMMGEGRDCTITSFTPEEAQDKIYKPIVLPIWQKWPIVFRPINNLSNAPESGLVFSSPRNVFNEKSLNSRLLLAENSKLTANDGGTLYGGLFDEQGKIKIVDTKKRWGVNKLTMAQGADIHGYATHPSTVEDMEEGGKIYQTMWNQSNFYERKENGQTISGLFREFRKAWDGYDGFIDAWGFSVIDKPTEEQIKYAPKDANFKIKKRGAKQYILDNRESLKRLGDPDSLEELRQMIRREPIDSTECFMGTSGSIGFDIQVLDSRIKELEVKKMTVPGNFEWVNERFGRVKWVPDENGKWESSITLHENETNGRLPGQTYSVIQQKIIEAWKPERPNKFIIGVDPVEYTNKSEAKLMDKTIRQSDFGIVLKIRKQKEDTQLDKRQWEGDRIGLTYRNRSENIDECCEDVLKAAIYTQSLIFFERNKGTTLWRNIVEWGFAGYLGYNISPDGKINELPGTYIQGANKNEGFELTATHIKYRGHKERHIDIMKEWREISGPEMLKKYDLVAAYIQCELGERSGFVDHLDQVYMEQGINVEALEDYFNSQNYLS